MKSVFTVLAVLLVTGLSGCAFDHLHNGFVVGKTKCSEIVAKAGVPTTQATPHDAKGEAIVYMGKGKYGESAMYIYSCDRNGILDEK
jgi:hypothetical protein